jgi:hypothetical protein
VAALVVTKAYDVINKNAKRRVSTELIVLYVEYRCLYGLATIMKMENAKTVIPSQ